MKRIVAALVTMAGAASALGADLPIRVPGKPAAAVAKAGASARFVPESLSAAPTQALRLVPLAARGNLAVAADAFPEKRMRVGIHRDVAREAEPHEAAPANLHWFAIPGGGHAARLSVTSPAAASLRIGLRARALPPQAELRFMGTDPRHPGVGPVSGAEAASATRDHGIYWSPVTPGETQTLEIRVPAGVDPSAVRLATESVSHLHVAPSELRKAAGIGASESCNEDVVCTAPRNPALERIARSVAKMVYTENGVSYLCTGTLISDGRQDSQVPYLYTAAHCMGTQAAAATLNTFWFFEAAACGGKDPGEYRQLSGGATLLYANDASDGALLRLAQRAPEGAWFAGWDASPLGNGTPLVSLHHPQGDLKKLTLGTSLGQSPAAEGAVYTMASWISGSTQGGSSGSGIFTLRDGEYWLRGALRGGSASCRSSGNLSDPSNRDYYSRMESESPSLAHWLSARPAPLEDFTGMWSNPEEPGWGLSLVQDASDRVFITWFMHDSDGRATWLVMPEVQWRTAASLQGTFYRASGSAFDQAHDPARFAVTAAGEGRIDFGHDGRAVATLTAAGRTIVKTIMRQRL